MRFGFPNSPTLTALSPSVLAGSGGARKGYFPDDARSGVCAAIPKMAMIDVGRRTPCVQVSRRKRLNAQRAAFGQRPYA